MASVSPHRSFIAVLDEVRTVAKVVTSSTVGAIIARQYAFADAAARPRNDRNLAFDFHDVSLGEPRNGTANRPGARK